MSEAKDQTLELIKSKLVQSLNPKKIYLFGSRGRGDHRADSDYDLLVVIEDSSIPRLQRELDARALLRGLDAAIDIFVYTQKEFDDWKSELSSIPETAIHEGRELELG
jgi:predicted nucleotidyltransferase